MELLKAMNENRQSLNLTGKVGTGVSTGRLRGRGEGRERIFTNVSHPTANNMEILVRR